ncbi:MAG: glycosyltransferase family 39 protein, partial [Planctomycetota bacterium]
MPRSPSAANDALLALLFALVMNALNLFEPLTVDDVCHRYYAAQVARDPLHPFEFELEWHQKPVPAWDVMVAPVTSYWWAPAVAAFGDSPVAWKAWFLPFQWLLCWSLLRLLRRHLRRHAAALTAAIVLGPAVLPGANLMLEVPLLALGFASLLALERACERRAAGFAALAGLLLGLALQTKYSAMGFFAPLLLLAALRRSWRELALAVAMALAVALAIEGLLALSHGGGSYFWRQLELTQRRHWSALVRGMVMHVGVLGLPAALLVLVGLRAPALTRWLLLLVHVLGYTLVALVPDSDERSLQDAAPDSLAYLAMALATWGTLGYALAGMLRTAVLRWRDGTLSRSVAARAFLVAWVAAELATSFVVSPFPAARRSLLVVVALTVAAGWLAVRRAGAAKAIRQIAAGAVVL